MQAKRLVIVEDHEADFVHLSRLLQSTKHSFQTVENAASLEKALELINQHPIDCCLLDCYLPDGNAVDLLHKLNREHGHMPCPIAVITGQEDTETAVELMKYGAHDYAVKQDITSESLEELIISVTKQWESQQQLCYMATHDSLTKLSNRAVFNDRLEFLFSESARYHHHFSLLYLDLDNFKTINDTHGHEAGDFVLQMVANKLQKRFRKTDLVSRLGGDEFTVLLSNTTLEDAKIAAESCLKDLQIDIDWQNEVIEVSPSIGVASHPSAAKTSAELLNNADYALYSAKESGKGQVRIFDSKMKKQNSAECKLTSSFPEALYNNDLYLVFQPVFDTKTKEVTSVEALIRWKFGETEVPAQQIIDFVVRLNLVDSFHQWLFKQALFQLKEWQTTMPDLMLSLNLPPGTEHCGLICKLLSDAIESSKIDPQKIILEIRESHLACDTDEVMTHLVELNQYGVKLSIDDFGDGLLSMKRLVSLPIESIKIDGHILKELGDKHEQMRMVKSIVALGAQLDTTIVAEGIETKNMYSLVSDLGCQAAQGYYLGRPSIACKSFNTFLKNSTHLQ